MTSSDAPAAGERPLLLYDGTCGFCARGVRFVLEHERVRRTLRFARLEGPIGRELTRRRPELASVDSMIWYVRGDDGKPELVLVKSAAALEIARYLGGVWAVLGALGRAVPRVVGDAVYDFVARHRHRIAGRAVCVIPAAEHRSRFVDLDG